MNEVSINSLPSSLKEISMVFKDEIKIYECEDMNEMLKINETDPLEFTVINQSKRGVVERRFFVGVALDMDYTKPSRERKPPRMFFTQMSDAQFDSYRKLVERKLLNDPPKELIY